MCPTGQQSMTKQTKLYTPRWIGLAVPCRVPPRSLLCDSEIVWFYPVLVVGELSSLTFCLGSCNTKTARKAGDTASHAQIEPAKEVMNNNDSRTHGDQLSPCTAVWIFLCLPGPPTAMTLMLPATCILSVHSVWWTCIPTTNCTSTLLIFLRASCVMLLCTCMWLVYYLILPV